MENTAEPKPTNPIHGIAHFSLDIWLGAAAISAVSYLLFLWSVEFFSFSSFWGYEPNPFGLYVNTLKTAAGLSLLLGLVAAVTHDKEIHEQDGRFSHAFLITYTIISDQADPPIQKLEQWKIKITSALIGGSLLIMLAAFFYLPFLSDANALPENLTLQSEPFELIAPNSDGIIIEPSDVIESSIDQNFFTLNMKSRTNYFILIEPVEKDSGHYGLSSSFNQLTPGNFSISSRGSSQSEKLDWVIVSSQETNRLDFEVLYSGAGPPSSYRIHVYENITNNQNILEITTAEVKNNQNIYHYPFLAERDKSYIFIAWPDSDAGTISISVNEEHGRNYPAARANKMDIALLNPQSTGSYDVTIRNPHGQLPDSFHLLVLSENFPSDGSESAGATFDTPRSSQIRDIINDIILGTILCNTFFFVLFTPLLVVRLIHFRHNRGTK